MLSTMDTALGIMAYIGALGLIGVAAYIFILGPVERVKIT